MRSLEVSASDLLLRSVSSLISPVLTFSIPLSYSPTLLIFLLSPRYLLFSSYPNGIVLKRVTPIFLIIVAIKNDCLYLIATLKPNL